MFELIQIAFQYAVAFGLGYALADLLVRELDMWEKLIIGAFLGPVLLGLTVLYANIGLGVPISALNARLLVLAAFAAYCFYRYFSKFILRRMRVVVGKACTLLKSPRD